MNFKKQILNYFSTGKLLYSWSALTIKAQSRSQSFGVRRLMAADAHERMR